MNDHAPGLRAFLRTLLDAGMSSQDAVAQGYFYALDAVWRDDEIWRNDEIHSRHNQLRIAASSLLKKVCHELEITPAQQKAALHEAV